MSWFRKLLLELLKVPPEPQPPPGSQESLRVFRAAPAYYRYSLVKWGLAQASALGGLLFSFGFISFAAIDFLQELDFIAALEIVFLPFLLFQAIATLALVRLRYELRWYMVSDRALRIREGIFKVREQTMTIANIQNMAVHQGPIQKLFGIADLQVRTAGGGTGEKGESGDGDPHLGRLAGLSNANEVRDLLLESLSGHRDSGLGDPDDSAHAAPSPRLAESANTVDAGEAAASLLDQVRGLREDLASREL